MQAGAFDVALQLLAAAEVAPLDELQRARVELLRAEAAYSQSRGSDAPALLLHAARTLEPLDQRLARDTYLDAWSAALFAGELATSAGLHEVSRAALDSPRGGDPPRPADLLLDGFAMALVEGRAASGPVLERAARGFAGNEVSVEEVLRWGWLATAAAVMVWDYETCVAVAARDVQLARDSGALDGAGGRRQRPGASSRAERGFRQGGVADRRGSRGLGTPPARRSLPTVRWCSRAYRDASLTRRR